MNKAIPLFVLLVSILLLIGPVLSNAETSKFVNVSIEVHGLEESAKTLNKVTLELARKFSEMSPDTEKMSADQLKELAKVIEQTNQLVVAINNSAGKTAATIESLKEPTKALVSGAMSSAFQSSVDPAIQSVNEVVTRWIFFSVIGLFLIVALIGFYIYFATRQIRAGVDVLKSITNEYEIVPKKLQEESNEIGKKN